MIKRSRSLLCSHISGTGVMMCLGNLKKYSLFAFVIVFWTSCDAITVWLLLSFSLDIMTVETTVSQSSPDFYKPKHATLCPCLFLCMHGANSVIRTYQSQVYQPKTHPTKWAVHSSKLSALHVEWSNYQCSLPTFGFRGTKRGAELIICISSETVKSNSLAGKWVLSGSDMMGADARTCQSVSGTHLPTRPSTTPRGAILLWTQWWGWERGAWAPYPFIPSKIDPIPVPHPPICRDMNIPL